MIEKKNLNNKIICNENNRCETKIVEQLLIGVCKNYDNLRGNIQIQIASHFKPGFIDRNCLLLCASLKFQVTIAPQKKRHLSHILVFYGGGRFSQSFGIYPILSWPIENS